MEQETPSPGPDRTAGAPPDRPAPRREEHVVPGTGGSAPDEADPRAPGPGDSEGGGTAPVPDEPPDRSAP